jgi:putative peptidoglycan lipid II flippase
MSDDGASQSRLMREGGKLSLLTMCSRVLGLAREMTKAAFMGTGALADAFAVSFNLPNFFRRLFAEGSMTVAFIPTFSGYLGAKDEEAEREFLSASLTVLTVLVISTVALGIACTPLLAGLFGSERSETIILTRMMFPFLAFVSLAALFQGILNSVGIFVPSALGPILFNVCFIAVPLLVGGWTENPARAMAVGVLAGGLVQALCQLPAVLRAGFRFGYIGLGRAFRNPGMKKVASLIGPTIVGMAAYNLNDLVCTSLASGVGAAAGIQYSIRLQELLLGIFAVSAGTVLLPHLTSAAYRKDWPAFTSDLGSVTRTIILLTLPVAVFSMVAGREIIVLLFRTRAFDEASVDLTVSVFFFHMAGLVFIAINRILSPAFYARSDTKTPTKGGVISFSANIVLAFVLVRLLGAPGIAIALSVACAINTLYLTIMLGRTGLPGIGEAIKSSSTYTVKVLLFSIIAIVPVILIRHPLLNAFSGADTRLLSHGVPVLLETLLFAGIGIGLLALSRDEIASSLIRRFSRRK